MVIRIFVPGHNSKHRSAALALYRNIIRLGKRIDLPQDVLPAGQGIHPVASIARRRFEGNRRFTSLRLIYGAMRAGYRTLTLLAKARTIESAEFQQVSQIVRGNSQLYEIRPDEAEAGNSSTGGPGTPFLVNVSPPGNPPVYQRGQEALPAGTFPSGKRRIPKLGHTSFAYPFLRRIKPQPEALSQKIRMQNATHVKNVELYTSDGEAMISDAVAEDEWDNIIDRQMKEEGLQPLEDSRYQPDASFVFSAHVTRMWAIMRGERRWQDWIARGEALQKIIDTERSLAAAEREGADQPAAAEKFVRPRGNAQLVVPARFATTKYLDTAQALYREQKAVEGHTDVYTLAPWRELVDKQQGNILRACERTKAREVDEQGHL